MAIEQKTWREDGHRLSAAVETVVQGGLEAVFDFLTAEDVLPKVLPGYGVLPGVVGTRDLTGPWDTPGSTRTVLLADGSNAREEVLAFERPRCFRYRIDRFSFALRHFATHGEGQFRFEEVVPGRTRVKWQYTFHAKNAPSALLLNLLVKTQWIAYMRVCMARTHGFFG